MARLPALEKVGVATSAFLHSLYCSEGSTLLAPASLTAMQRQQQCFHVAGIPFWNTPPIFHRTYHMTHYGYDRMLVTIIEVLLQQPAEHISVTCREVKEVSCGRRSLSWWLWPY